MATRYAIWDKTSDIYTLGTDPNTGKNHYTASEYIQTFAPWAAKDGVNIIVGSGVINGTCFMEFDATKESYVRRGADFSKCTTPEEVLTAIEAFEDKPADTSPTAEERIAAALEYQTVASMPDA